MDYDLHLSATQISSASVKVFTELGFSRDEFTNNTRCMPSTYHGTFRGTQTLPDDTLWDRFCDILQLDSSFVGCLEEESIEEHHKRALLGVGSTMPPPLPPLSMVACPAELHKACDVHIGATLPASTPEAIEHLELMELVSFDKPTPEGTRRVFTATCQTQTDGERFFDILCTHLSRVPGFRGKMKLEITTRYLRYPADAPTLPIATSDSIAQWISSFSP